MTQSVLPGFGFKEDLLKVEEFGTGLINSTWKVTAPGKAYILQRVNHDVFKQPEDIAHNISLIADFLKLHYPEYKFIAPITTNDGNGMIYDKDKGYFRLFPFVPGSHSKDVIETPEQAFEAASQFGRFTKLLSGIDINKIRITIPRFHDLSLRYQQFLLALKNGNKTRIEESAQMIKTLMSYSDIVKVYHEIISSPDFKLRVTHHDTKISNVLFDSNDKGLCVIDLDTVMPGYFFSDMGDMMRTYLSPVSEEESDFEKITVREDFYQAIVLGYSDEMKDELTLAEKKYFFYAGSFMIYMQALRFLTDYLNDDLYYGSTYPGHNYIRAMNQTILLQEFSKKIKETNNNKLKNIFRQ